MGPEDSVCLWGLLGSCASPSLVCGFAPFWWPCPRGPVALLAAFFAFAVFVVFVALPPLRRRIALAGLYLWCFQSLGVHSVLACGLAGRGASHSPAGAAILVAAFVLLAAVDCVYSATACGLPDPVGGSCLQPVGAATLVALLAASFVFVPLWIAVPEFAGSLNLNGWDASATLLILRRYERDCRRLLVCRW